MATLNESKIKEEILNLIRNSDILTTSQRGVTTTTDNLVASASQTDFTLTNAGVKNIRSITVNLGAQTVYVDYDINIDGKTATESQTVTFTTPMAGGEAVAITYDYSTSGDKVYPDFPEDYLSVGAYPRIAFDIVSINNRVRSVNDTLHQKTLAFDFGVFASNKTVESIEKALYDLIFANRKTLYHIKLLRPAGRSGKESYKKFSSTIIYNKLFTYMAPSQFER